MKHKQPITCIVPLLLLLLVLCGCHTADNAEPTVPPDDTAPTAPMNYVIDYHRYSPLLKESVGETVISDACVVIDAFMARKTSAAIAGEKKDMNDLGYALNHMCPTFYVCTDYNEMTAYADGVVHWTYLYDEQTVDAMVSAFARRVGDMVGQIDQNDCQTAQAMLLYRELTRSGRYDDAFNQVKEHTAEESRMVTSPYNAIVNGSGICTSYAQALAFLYTQVGIDGTAVSGESAGVPHAWTLARLDGDLFYFDPTWDLGGGFKYFGLSAADRAGWAGQCSRDTFWICGVYIDHLYDVSSDRFAPIHDALDAGYVDFVLHHATQTAGFMGNIVQFDCRQG